MSFITPADDISKLKIIRAEALQAFVADLNASPDKGLKRVVVISTGGTLAMLTRDDGVRLPQLDFSRVFDYINPQLVKKFSLHGFDAFSMDSSQMTYAHVREIAIALTYIWNNLTVPIIGFLVMHGTDTMSYAAAAMSLMMGQGLPFSIVYTGAQKPINEPLSDAPPNIRNALFLLEGLHDKNMAEVIISMGDYAMLATSAEKVDDTKANAFDAPRHQYVAAYNRLQYPVPLAKWLKPKRDVPFNPTIFEGDYSRTLIVRSHLGLRPEMVMVAEWLHNPEVMAVIIYSYGAGTIHEDVVQKVMHVSGSRGIPVFLVNPTDAQYNIHYESALKAVQQGAAPLDMTLSSALAKMEVALCLHPGDAKAQATFMRTNYVGEIPNDTSRFVPTKY